MSSKELKADKKFKKQKSNLKNGGQQVYVLPPNLLQKLGINLGNVGYASPNMQSQMSTSVPNNKYGQTSTNMQHETSSNILNNESSIVKTASLMKESVFLSPTFNSADLNNVTSSQIGENVETCNAEVNYMSQSKITSGEKSSNVTSEPFFFKNDKLNENHKENSCVIGVTNENNVLQTSPSTNSEIPVLQNEAKKSINIISEETVSVAKLNELKVLQIPPKIAMIPASLNTIIIKKYSRTQSPTIQSCADGFVKDLEYNKSNEKLIDLHKTNNVINMNPTPCHNTENHNNEANNECYDINIEVSENKDMCDENIQSISSIQTELSKSFAEDHRQITTINIMDNLGDSNIGRKADISPGQNNFDAIVNKSDSIDIDLIEDMETSTQLNNYDLDLHINNNESLFNDHNNVPKGGNDILESVAVDGISQNVECYLSDTINTNNNIWDHIKLDVTQNKTLMGKDTTHVGNFQTSNISNDKHPASNTEDFEIDSIATSIKQNGMICETNENISVGEEEILFEIINDNMGSLTENLKLATNQSVPIAEMSFEKIHNNVGSVTEDFKSKTNQFVPVVIDDGAINNLSLPFNSKRNNFMSKLCIQGVEKPGGIETDSQKTIPLKTYSNKNKHKISEKCLLDRDTILDLRFDHNSNIDLKETNTINFVPCHQFCECYDYGTLDYDQFENNYEHGHFKTKISMDCSPEIIFSIYNNDTTKIQEITENLDVEDITDQTDSGYSGFYICWCNADLLETKFDNEFENTHNDEKAIQIYSHVGESEVNYPKCQSEDKFHLNSSPDAIIMPAKTEAHEKSYSKYDRNISNKLDLENESRKRKSSNNCDEMSENKKLKNVDCNEKEGDSKQKELVTKSGLKGSQGSDNIDASIKQEYVKCAVCGINVTNADWLIHIATTHDYIAWKDGEFPVDLTDENAIRVHLHQLVQELGELKCSNCGLTRKYAKPFLHHLKSCYSLSDVNNDRQVPYHLSKICEVLPVAATKCEHCGYESRNEKDYTTHMKRCIVKSKLSSQKTNDNSYAKVSVNVTCGVCKEEMSSDQWLPHIQQKHSYQAWREGETPLNFQDQESIKKHLYRILQEHGPLVCSKCGVARKYAKSFLQHISSCTGPKEDENTVDTSCADFESSLHVSLDDSEIESTKLVKCGRCELEMESRDWVDHIKDKHNYLSWQEGQTSLDLSDDAAVRRYLYIVVQKLGALTCVKCGVSRKYVKNYLSHIDNCTGPVDSNANSTNDTSVNARTSIEEGKDVSAVATVKCAVCQKEMRNSIWMTHISMNHEYLAWKETESPIDLSNLEAISEHLTNVIKCISTLKCADCGKKFKNALAFLLHIKACYGKIYVSIEDEKSILSDSNSDMDSTLESSLNPTFVNEEEDDSRKVQCGVCREDMEARLWMDHVHRQHNYLAWREGDTALDLECNESIERHMNNIKRKIGRLTCAKCGLRRRKDTPFAIHLKTCDGTTEELNTSLKSKRNKTGTTEIVQCAVCQTKMAENLWIDHVIKEHDYMAWKCGDEPLDVDDESAVKNHLYQISHQEGGLVCSNCGLVRKYVKSYQQHVRSCNGSGEIAKNPSTLVNVKEELLENVTCALCRLEMSNTMWIEHISKKHNYIAWKENESPLVFEDEKSLRNYLYNIVQSLGSLICYKCDAVRKYAKTYLQHIEICQKVTWITINRMTAKLTKEKGHMVQCAVCRVEVDDTEWLEHSARAHGYLAWRDGDPPLNLKDEDEVRRHLKNIIQEEGYLQCPKCNLQRRYVKLYLHHVNTCDGTEVHEEMDDSVNNSGLSTSDGVDDEVESRILKCGVCAQEMVQAQWYEHIQKEHKYLAWEEGKEPLDVNDKEAVSKHLSAISAKCMGLTCAACGITRKFARAYLSHIQDCTGRTNIQSDEVVECGVCGEKMTGNLWRDHAMNTHYNLAWIVGDTPIDLRNFLCIDKYLKEYQDCKNKLECNICGLSRASLAGFYAHVLICGKTKEEIESWKDVCTICNQKYLCIYKTQHYWTHKVAEVAKERKIQATRKKEEQLKQEENFTPGRRKAAQRARCVIEDYAAKYESYKCKSCPFESDAKEDLENHRCFKRSWNADSDDSVSIKSDDSSEEESEDTDVDSELSNDEEEAAVSATTKKKIIKEKTSTTEPSTKNSKFPFDVTDVKSYLQKSKSDHFELYHTKETLFTHWRDLNYEVVSDDSVPQYLPQTEESCKLSISNGGWTTYKRFESKKESGCKVMFTGGSIQCMAWAPVAKWAGGAGGAAERSVLAVAAHRGPDCPRLHPTDLTSHPALVQMWDFQYFNCLPKMAFGLAHDYGTVWAMDWCPSGARDFSEKAESDNIRPRLGLLALACSNGSAYVLSVPYPDKNATSGITLYKVKPCAELRLTRGPKKYQATSINWCLFKGYTTISVGYGDGTLALYDLVSESPLLTAKEGDINILYPYQDERVHNSCVTGLTSNLLGAWCSSSVTGTTAGVAVAEPRAGRGAHPLRTHTALAGSAATFMPHWPNVMLSGDDTIVGLSPSELEWGYTGRRVGSVRALAACPHRARVAALVPPLLQAMRPHPAAFKGHKTINKKNVAMIEMTPLARKRSKHSNDELSMKVEPITYEEAIASYGIEFKFEKGFDKVFVQRMQQKNRVPYPERFPLADVPALAYCPTPQHHTKLALATHAGLLLLLDV